MGGRSAQLLTVAVLAQQVLARQFGGGGGGHAGIVGERPALDDERHFPHARHAGPEHFVTEHAEPQNDESDRQADQRGRKE